MVSFKSPEYNSTFNSSEVFLLSESDQDIKDIGGVFKNAGMNYNVFSLAEQDFSENKSMLLIDESLFDGIELDTYEKKIKPFHFIFSFGKDENDSFKERAMDLLGRVMMPIEDQDVHKMVLVCEQAGFYEGKINELERANDALQKISSLGRFTGSLIHDLNNYNTICMTAFDGVKLVNKKHEQNEKINFLADKGLKGCKMLNSLSLKYRRFMHAETEIKQEFFELSGLINEALNLMNQDLSRNQITYKTQVPKKLNIMCNDTSMIQVFVNLISNSIFEIKEKEQKWISIKVKNNGAGIIIYFIDSGNGISKDIRTRIFDPLFTTKSKNDGTGFGLNFCKQELSDMEMDLKYVENKNTTFAIEVPKDKVYLKS